MRQPTAIVMEHTASTAPMNSTIHNAPLCLIMVQPGLNGLVDRLQVKDVAMHQSLPYIGSRDQLKLLSVKLVVQSERINHRIYQFIEHFHPLYQSFYNQQTA
jgi:hypothetical protein